MFDQLFKKLGIKSYEDLNYEERETLKRWQEVLAKPNTSVDDLKTFLPTELARARQEQNDYENKPKKDLFLKAYIRILETLSAIIITPENQREQLRAELKRKYNLE